MKASSLPGRQNSFASGADNAGCSAVGTEPEAIPKDAAAAASPGETGGADDWRSAAVLGVMLAPMRPTAIATTLIAEAVRGGEGGEEEKNKV